MSREVKVLITGPMGAGKTTALASVSDGRALKTEATNSDLKQHQKSHTTVALDFCEIELSAGDRLRIYGTPGQRRFNAMWKILAKGSLGVVVLLDLTRPDPIADLREYLADFSEVVAESCAVIGAGRSEERPDLSVSMIADACAELGLMLPVFAVDVRQKADVLMLLEALFSQIEIAHALSEES
jgi:uncharacterized protein